MCPVDATVATGYIALQQCSKNLFPANVLEGGRKPAPPIYAADISVRAPHM